MSRPTVSIVVPFRGDEDYASRLRRILGTLELAAGDELIVADNTDEGIAGPTLGPAAKVVRATGEASSYHARNSGARSARGEWILFLDADCSAPGDLLDRYFAEPVPDDCGVLAGSIDGLEEQRGLLARYTRDRGFYDGQRGIGANGAEEGGAAPGANLLIRRRAFDEIGGFVEGIRSAGDFDLCWRLQAAGWRLLRRPAARVHHRHREDLRSFLAMLARYGAGARWMARRYPGAVPRWRLLPGLWSSVRDVFVNAVRLNPREALYRSIDAVGLVAYNVGYGRSNELRAG
ncbi:MAG TPA: glycosyltransferase [Solirubrobacterales bacterium]|nr:glycosyltransferase [Solirubrobacterales bacterium]